MILRRTMTSSQYSINRMPSVMEMISVSVRYELIFYILCLWFRASLINFLIIVQRDATQNGLFIILQVHSTCFGCQTHSSSGVHKTVTTASGTVQLPPSNVAKLAWPR